MARRSMWGFEMAVVVLGLLAMTQQSMQLSLRNRPLANAIRRINAQGPFLGLVMVSNNNEKALNASNTFIPNQYVPNVTVSGRTFHVGSLNGANIIYVKTGEGALNAAVAVQILISTFHVDGIVHYGSAGAVVNDTLFIGDVALVSQTACIGSWNWKSFQTKKGQLKFGDYNYPDAGKNLLGSVDFNPSTLFTPSGSNKTVFWLPLNNSTWFDTASKLQNVAFEQCINTTKCLPNAPQFATGVKAATTHAYISNAAYREFVATQFKVSIVDQETAAIALVAYANDVPLIAFRGVSNTAGGSTAYKSYSYLGSVNAFTAAATFISAISTSSTTSMPKYYSIV